MYAYERNQWMHILIVLVCILLTGECAHTYICMHTHTHTYMHTYIHTYIYIGRLRVNSTVVGNGHTELTSNPERGCLHFHIALIPFGIFESNDPSSIYEWVEGKTGLFILGMATSLGEEKLFSNLFISFWKLTLYHILLVLRVGWLVGLILWHINHCWLFNAKSSLYIYVKYIWFGLVRFYGISTIAGYLMPNPLYTYIKYIWFVNTFCW